MGQLPQPAAVAVKLPLHWQGNRRYKGSTSTVADRKKGQEVTSIFNSKTWLYGSSEQKTAQTLESPVKPSHSSVSYHRHWGQTISAIFSDVSFAAFRGNSTMGRTSIFWRTWCWKTVFQKKCHCGRILLPQPQLSDSFLSVDSGNSALINLEGDIHSDEPKRARTTRYKYSSTVIALVFDAQKPHARIQFLTL